MNAMDLIRILAGRLDEDVPPAIYRSVSVDTDEYRSNLSALGLRHAADGGRATIAELDEAAEHAIRSSIRVASVVGGVGGLAGWMGVPPEAAARVVQSARLAQRLAIIYGHDLGTDRGEAHVRQALAAAWGVELPAQMQADLRLSDLPLLVQRRARKGSNAPTYLVRTLGSAALTATAKRAPRLIPGIGATLGLLGARRVARGQAESMKRFLRTPHLQPDGRAMDDAVIVSD